MSDGDDKKGIVLDKGWISKRSKNGRMLGMLTVQSEEEESGFNLSESGSYREGLLHISQQGTTIHSASDLSGGTPVSPCLACLIAGDCVYRLVDRHRL